MINHAKAEKFRKIISEVRRVLKKGGVFAFNVLSDKDGWFGKGKEIEKNTFLPVFCEDEADVPHHFFSGQELKAELKGFRLLKFSESIGWSKRRKEKAASFEVICEN